MMFARVRLAILQSAVLPLVLVVAASGIAERMSLQLDPARTTVKFTLDAALHIVHGTFHAKQSTLQFDPTSGKISGEILVDAKSGQTGNGIRDRKMNNDVLESERYPEISFRPDHVEGSVAAQGKSAVMIHGIFNIHGADREITVPVQVEMNETQWAATARFRVPYANWGMKNPSTLFLRVSDSVEIELAMAGSIVEGNASSAPQ